MFAVVVGIVVGVFTLWRTYVVEQTTALQFGALGVLLFVLFSVYKLSKQWMDFKVNQKPLEPVHNNGEMPYNEQMARTIYDVNKTLSEVSVTNKLIIVQVNKHSEIMEKQTLVLDRLVNILGQKHNLNLGSDG